MKKVVFFCIPIFLFGIFPSIARGEVGSFVFSNEPQHISLNILSNPFAVTSRSVTGEQENVPETTDLTFTSSSPTGQFLNSSGNTVSTIMSKNTGSRTFYYKDSSEGTFTLTVRATGRTTQKVFVASQTVIVGNGPVDTNPIASTNVGTSEVSQTTEPVLSNLSSVAEEGSVSRDEEYPVFKVSAGKDRLASVGSEIQMRATVSKLSEVLSQTIGYAWSFGDGTFMQGQVVSHAYRFPGEYEVVLTAGARGQAMAVSRLVVYVTQPNIRITKVLGGIQITNNSVTEINFGGWTLQCGVRHFTFPVDTIIAAKKSIVVAHEVSGLQEGDRDIRLVDPLYKMVAETISIENMTSSTTKNIATSTVRDETKKVKNVPKKIISKPVTPAGDRDIVEATSVEKDGDVQPAARKWPLVPAWVWGLLNHSTKTL